MINFEIGKPRFYRGQVYDCLGTERVFSKRFGRDVTVVRLRSFCADCAAPFEILVPDRRAFAPNRRCQGCKRPGVRV